MWLTIIVFVLVLSVLVFVHELGHFFTARRLGVKSEEFGFGFPPRILGIYKSKSGKWKKIIGNKSSDGLHTLDKEGDRPAKKSTIYSLNWLPIGGFVKIKGENGDGENDDDSFASKKIWKRVLILSAGVLMNVILAWALFSWGYMIGLPQSTDNVSEKAIVSEQMLVVAQVVSDSPAEKAGLKLNDIIISADGEILVQQEELQALTSNKGGEEINFLVKRGDEETSVPVTPIFNEDSNKSEIGVSVVAGGLVRYPFFQAIWEGLVTTLWMLKEIILAFVMLIVGIFSGHGVGGELAGPVGIANFTGQMARLGTSYLLQFTAFLSLNLAVLNFLPFPALDGGRVLFLLIEKIIGRPVKRDIEALIHNLGFILLIIIVLIITYKDIIRLF